MATTLNDKKTKDKSSDSPLKDQKAASQSSTEKNDYFELKVPKINYSGLKLSPFWVILLLVFSYLLGMQTAKLTYIEKKMAEDKTTTAAAPAQPTDPNKPALGAKVAVTQGSLPPLGNKNAKVTMVEFSDFQCPFCERFFTDTYSKIKKEYIDTGKVKFTFRHLPLDIHPLAPTAAQASECANDQNKFWDFHDQLFTNYSDWSSLTVEDLPAKFQAYAVNLGLNADEFSTCLSSGKNADKVNKDKSDATTAGATGTPSFFINGQILVGALPFETFKTLLDQELKK